MVKLIRKIKKFLPQKSRIFFSYLSDLNHNPYRLKALINPPEQISDFFIFDSDCKNVGFIAENVRALLLGQETPVIHKFIFFSKDGKSLGTQSFETKKFFKKIIFNPITSEDKYLSFIHYVESSQSLLKILKDKGIINSLKLSEQNRGYSIYYSINKTFGSIVHGNFGGITKDLEKMARITFWGHIYTPIYKLEKNSVYDLVFNNPTRKMIVIKIIFNNLKREINLKIPSMGTRFLRVDKYTGSLSFESNLPICRPLIFKNPTPNSDGSFDVLHS